MEIKHVNEKATANEIAENMKNEIENIRFLINNLYGTATMIQMPKLRMLQEQVSNMEKEIDILTKK